MGNRAEDSRSKESSGSGSERLSAGTPEDVAALFTWANLQGGRYWDFSESRRRYRQQVRECAAAALEEQRRQEKRAAPGLSGAPPAVSSSNSRVQVLSSRAGLPWIEEQHPGGPQFLRSHRYPVAEDFVELSRETGKHQAALLWEPAPVPTAQEPPAEDAGEVWRRSLLEEPQPQGVGGSETSLRVVQDVTAHDGTPVDTPRSRPAAQASAPAPAWIYPAPAWIYEDAPQTAQPGPRAILDLDPLSRVVFHGSGVVGHPDVRGSRAETQQESPAALVTVFSTSGGVGRTSLLATLGCALSRAGERVALGDTTEYSSLPLYFGAREVCLGLSRAFASPAHPNDPPVFIASYDVARAQTDPTEQRRMMGEILRNGARANRILLDLPASAEWLFRRIATLQPTVLVPIVPDVDVVVTLDAVERFFEPISDSEGDSLRPLYLLSQFDPALALHQDVREILESQVGPRLLSTVIRKSALVREALTEGLTVLDYAPSSAVAQDYLDLAGWLQTAAPAVPSLAHAGGVL